MSWRSALQAAERAQKREIRGARARQRQFERMLKEEAKASVQEIARIEVEAFEAQIESLLSIHKDCGPTWDWRKVSLRLSAPVMDGLVSFETTEQRALLRESFFSLVDEKTREARLLKAAQEDKHARDAYSRSALQSQEEARELRAMARKILFGEISAYSEAMTVLNPFSELSEVGSSIHFTFHNARTAECRIDVNGRDVIPAEQKLLTASGKLSTKSMSKSRFHELYQDYVCGCMLRMAREVFALLPVELTIVTATVAEDGSDTQKAVASVVIRRAELLSLDFQSIDPSDAIERFRVRSSLKISRRTGKFEEIQPWKFEELEETSESISLLELKRLVSRFRQELSIEAEQMFE